MLRASQGGALASTQVGTVLLALGANTRGRWGAPAEGIRRACHELAKAGVGIVGSSSLYLTEPVGGGRQAPYLNAVIVASAARAPATLLRLVKQIERRAGRRFGALVQARPLDIDILDHGGRRLAWPPWRRERGRLILPHPLAHKRTFVLVPLLEVAPHWRHPVFGQRPKGLLARLSPRARSGVLQALDLPACPCDKASALRLRFGSTAPGPIVHAALNSTRRIVTWRV